MKNDLTAAYINLTGFRHTLFILLMKDLTCFDFVSQAYVSSLWRRFLKYQWMAVMIQPDNNASMQLWDEPDRWKRRMLLPPTNPWIASPFKTSVCVWANVFWHTVRPLIPNRNSVRELSRRLVRSSKTNPVVICGRQSNIDGFLKALFQCGCLATPLQAAGWDFHGLWCCVNGQ